MKESKANYIECVCQNEIIRLSLEGDEQEMPVYLRMACYEHGTSDKKTSVKEKWQMIKHIIKHGTPYADEVLLDIKGVQKLRDKLGYYHLEIEKNIQKWAANQPEG